MIGTFLIFLREGIEGSLIVSIILTYLAHAGRRDLFRWVFAGVGAALACSALVGVILYLLFKKDFLGSDAQEWFETGTFIAAVIILTYMTFWMKRNSRQLSGAIREDLHSAILGNSAIALAGVAFFTVGREAIETAILTVAIAFHTSRGLLAAGALVGLATAMAVSVAMYRMGVKLNLKLWFDVLGACLLVVAAGLLANAVENLQGLGVLPGAGQVLWRTGGLLSEEKGLGDILHGLLGYAAAPTALQFGVWIVFLAFTLWIFLGVGHSLAGKRRPGTQATAGP